MKHFNRYLFEKIAFLVAFQLISGCDNPARQESSIPVQEAMYTYLVYEEAADPNPVDPESWSSVPDFLQGSFGSPDIRYGKSIPPGIKEINNVWTDYAWRGERVSTQLVLWSAADKGNLSFEWSEFKSDEGTKLPATSLKARFVRYVLTDEFAEGCGHRNSEDFDVSLVADAIDEVDELAYEGKTNRPVWVSIDVPENIDAGLYSGSLFVKSGMGDKLEFKIEIEVGNATLPGPSGWSYHLDLWQNPFAVARFHQVEPWSEAHFIYLEPMIRMLADAGQKVITTNIIDRPWNGQAQDPYQAMIDWRKQTDGTWHYDYSIFDKWVVFAEKCGITSQINCYTMIPWGNKFFYYNETTGGIDSLVASPGTEAYESHWKPFLLDFSKHLKQKGWFEKTAIAMDERPVEDMQKAIKFVARVVPGMKMTLAGGYHPEIEKDLFDMCVASNQQIPEGVMSDRLATGKPTTYYTCCVEAYPNNFTFSPPAESTWQAWHAASKGYTGYLRWAYNSWVSDPLTDSRFRSWPAGDTYMVYPEARTSIRFERFREGIQDYEKIRIIREKFAAENTSEANDKLQLLEDHLQQYEISALETTPAGLMLQEGKNILEQLSKQVL